MSLAGEMGRSVDGLYAVNIEAAPRQLPVGVEEGHWKERSEEGMMVIFQRRMIGREGQCLEVIST